MAGVDEVGRGPLAGPVVAAAVVLPPLGKASYKRARRALLGLRDSKQLTAAARTAYSALIMKHAVTWAIGARSVEQIDRDNILRASLAAMRAAVDGLAVDGCALWPEVVLVDGNYEIPELDVAQQAIIAGDTLCVSIAAASVIAKVYRDNLMRELHDRFPAYGFDRNKGYGTPRHLKVLADLGPCPVHRRSFRPVQFALNRQFQILP